MQTRKAGFSGSLFLFGLLIAAALSLAEDNTEGNTVAVKKDIHQSKCLSAGEQKYVNERKQLSREALSRLGIQCDADSVPHITLLSSGGGQRAAVGLVGTLYQMKTEGLLDTVLYLGGVSGSTWSMSTLYSDPQWSNNMDMAVSRLMEPGVKLEQALAWLGERAKEELFSLTDIWGVLTSAGIMKQMDIRHLSDEAKRNATNPYPIYSAIERQCFSNGPIEGKWFEVSPHEAGFTELGIFIETSLLGSRFEGGELLEKKAEMDMVRLQGLLGCALAHSETIRDFIPHWLNVPAHLDSVAEEYLRVYNALDELVALTRSTIEDPVALSNLDKLQKILEDQIHHNHTVWQSEITEERNQIFQQWIQDIVAAVEAWCDGLEEGNFKTHVTLLTKQVLPLIIKWEWGTTSNFLYQYHDSTIPTCLSSKERFHLIDAGLLINVAYPTFLGSKRDIDLFISPEYSGGNIFETLTLARDYAAKVKKPFPEIDNKILEERDWPKSCYVFEGKANEATIVYLPLFNRDNCKDAAEFKARMAAFSTFQLPFSREKIEFVLETAKANVERNRETLLSEIYKATLRRYNKRMSGQHQVAGACALASV